MLRVFSPTLLYLIVLSDGGAYHQMRTGRGKSGRRRIPGADVIACLIRCLLVCELLCVQTMLGHWSCLLTANIKVTLRAANEEKYFFDDLFLASWQMLLGHVLGTNPLLLITLTNTMVAFAKDASMLWLSSFLICQRTANLRLRFVSQTIQRLPLCFTNKSKRCDEQAVVGSRIVVLDHQLRDCHS